MSNGTRSKGKSKQTNLGVFLFVSDDGKQMALMLNADVPLEVRQFVNAVSVWVRNAQLNADAIEEILSDEGEDGHAH